MPGLDGTGPMGQGPATGRGFGYCVQEQPLYAGRGRGAGFGRGRGSGMGRGMGFRRGFHGNFGRFRGYSPLAYQAYPYPYEITAEDEMAYLRKQAVYLEEQIKEIHKRISDLNKEETPES